VATKPAEYLIVYKTPPRVLLDNLWLLGGAGLLALAAAAWLVGLEDPGMVIGAGLLAPLALALLTLQNKHIRLRQDGMHFPVLLASALHLRTHRSWSDIGAVMLADTEGPDYFETAAVESKELVIHFTSGGSVRLSLADLSVQDLDAFFQASKAWGSTAVFAPELIELKHKLLPGPAPAPRRLSFTALWEEEMQSHFTATAYVPLARGTTRGGGRFKILTQLAAGGFAAIYLARRSDGSLVVLKEAVLPTFASDQAKATARKLFAREARTLIKLSHPRIAKVHDHFVEAGREYLVMDYIEGLTLRQLVSRDGPQREDQVLDWALEVADLLAYLHAQVPPLVHRDISPDNLLLGSDRSLFLIDFGAASEFVGTATGTFIGKQSYIAPEQFRGKAQPASDIYGLGATLYYLLAGSEPEPLSVSHPADTRPGISHQVDELVAACTALAVAKRIGTAATLRETVLKTRAAERGTIISLKGKSRD
jgi:tRNA A-37 threonylcarbamoyl transferase component Bud32